ncbi:hypothetical protein QR98_0091910 [Sarcoptes scabiei]|uniref:Uncharacterized protein n=1 Tax=Sarcoptes scabiei TaxID=52283 RepID=A0A132AI20_SARSC|nr:hypothetical protein QR98_0091910 [Sarcoptes scabiei]
MSIADLLQAAEYLERREREAEHGYATPLSNDFSKRRSKSKKSLGSRIHPSIFYSPLPVIYIDQDSRSLFPI